MVIVPNAPIQAVMAGRTLYEVATGRVPMPGVEIDRDALKESNVSAAVADVVDGLATGSFDDVRPALKYLTKRAVRRIVAPPVGGTFIGATPVAMPSPAVPVLARSTVMGTITVPPAASSAPVAPVSLVAAVPVDDAPTADEVPSVRVVTQDARVDTDRRPWWRRILGL